jgi:hypothetical protein
VVQISECSECDEIIEAICDLNWEDLSQADLIAVAASYHYFSIQFRESLQVARRLYPNEHGQSVALAGRGARRRESQS